MALLPLLYMNLEITLGFGCIYMKSCRNDIFWSVLLVLPSVVMEWSFVIVMTLTDKLACLACMHLLYQTAVVCRRSRVGTRWVLIIINLCAYILCTKSINILHAILDLRLVVRDFPFHLPSSCVLMGNSV